MTPLGVALRAQTFSRWPTSVYAGSVLSDPNVNTFIRVSCPPATRYPDRPRDYVCQLTLPDRLVADLAEHPQMGQHM
jgi:hypothetical protein